MILLHISLPANTLSTWDSLFNRPLVGLLNLSIHYRTIVIKLEVRCLRKTFTKEKKNHSTFSSKLATCHNISTISCPLSIVIRGL